MDFKLPIRVYYEDTDAGGVVYHARYLHFFERARTEYLRTLQFSQQEILAETGLAFVVRKAELDYCLPARLDDLLAVETEIESISAAAINFKQVLVKQDIVLCTAMVKVVCVDLNKMKAVAIPSHIKAALVSK